MPQVRRSETTTGVGRSDTLCLFGCPCVIRDGRRVPVPDGAQRLLVLVALRGGWLDRRSVAGTLWPDGSDHRAAGNLRSAIWRLKAAGLDLLAARGGLLCLDEGVVVDVHAVAAWADRLVRGTHDDRDLAVDGRMLDPDDLLPGWQDDWVIFERERMRQRILHGLEALSLRLRQDGRFAEAVEAALCVVHMEPLRESAQRVLILAHLAEGNQVEAHRALTTYSRLLQDELGLPASPQMCELLRMPPSALS